jgi:hypothetical protein
MKIVEILLKSITARASPSIPLIRHSGTQVLVLIAKLQAGTYLPSRGNKKSAVVQVFVLPPPPHPQSSELLQRLVAFITSSSLAQIIRFPLLPTLTESLKYSVTEGLELFFYNYSLLV